jgi:hypothetical protein
MAVTSQHNLAEVLRWFPGVNPNPPDPWLALVLEVGDPSLRQAALQSYARMNAAYSQAQAQFWTEMERAAGASRTP